MKNIWEIIKLLFPLNRSLSGEGNRETFSIIKKLVLPNLEIKKIKYIEPEQAFELILSH